MLIFAYIVFIMATIRYIAFLRGINVSGQKIIKMEDLRKMCEMPGISNVSTYIQSGNVLFSSIQTDEVKLIAKLEKQLAAQLGYAVSVIIRNHEQMLDVVAHNPYPASLLKPGDERKLSITFLQETHLQEKIAGLHTESGTDELKVLDREVYILYTAYGNSKLSNALIEKKLGVKATTRNWATVNKIAELLKP